MKTNIKAITTEVNDIPSFLSESTLSVTIWFTGCIHDCKGCQNPQLQTIDSSGLDIEFIKDELEKRRILCDWVVFSGGDPMHDLNEKVVEELAVFAKGIGYKTFVYTGYDMVGQVNGVDYVKTGIFVENDGVDEFWLASRNQSIWRIDGLKKVYWYDKGIVYNKIEKRS